MFVASSSVCQPFVARISTSAAATASATLTTETPGIPFSASAAFALSTSRAPTVITSKNLLFIN